MSVLLLNASYEPLRIITWQRAICLQLAERADLIAESPDRKLRAAGGAEFPFPSVVRLREMVIVPFQRGTPPITRRALAARDGGMCQKSGCDQRGTTMDHVLAKSRQGTHSWNNIVLMCAAHNNEKGDRTLDELGWKLKKRPVVPKQRSLMLNPRDASPQWLPWLGTGFVDDLEAAS